MKVYFDTSVLVAASLEAHPHHVQAVERLNEVWSGRWKGFICSQGLAEFYAVVTRLPHRPKVHPADVSRFLTDDILPHFALVELTAADVQEAVANCVSLNRPGTSVFELLHFLSARKSACERIYTLNGREFRTLLPADWQDRVATP